MPRCSTRSTASPGSSRCRTTAHRSGTLGSGASTDNYGDSYTTMDAKISVPLNRRLRSFLELRNLNDEPRRRYSGTPQYRTSYEIYSWNLFAGVDWRF